MMLLQMSAGLRRSTTLRKAICLGRRTKRPASAWFALPTFERQSVTSFSVVKATSFATAATCGGRTRLVQIRRVQLARLFSWDQTAKTSETAAWRSCETSSWLGSRNLGVPRCRRASRSRTTLMPLTARQSCRRATGREGRRSCGHLGTSEIAAGTETETETQCTETETGTDGERPARGSVAGRATIADAAAATNARGGARAVTRAPPADGAEAVTEGERPAKGAAETAARADPAIAIAGARGSVAGRATIADAAGATNSRGSARAQAANGAETVTEGARRGSVAGRATIAAAAGATNARGGARAPAASGAIEAQGTRVAGTLSLGVPSAMRVTASGHKGAAAAAAAAAATTAVGTATSGRSSVWGLAAPSTASTGAPKSALR